MANYWWNEISTKGGRPDFKKDYPLLVKYSGPWSIPDDLPARAHVEAEWETQNEEACAAEKVWEIKFAEELFIKELKCTRKNKQHLIDVFDCFFVKGWNFHKYMWKPFTTQNLVDVRTIIHDYFATSNFENIWQYPEESNTDYWYYRKPYLQHGITLHLLGAFDNIEELNKHMNEDFLLSLKDLQREDLDFRNVWDSLNILSSFFQQENKYGNIWHNVIPNAIEIRAHGEPIGLVTRDEFSAEDANWQRSKHHKEAYLDQKIKGKI